MFQKHPPEKLIGERIELRKHELSSAEAMFREVDSDRTRLGRFLPWVAGMHSPQDEKDFIEHTHREWEEFRLFDYSIMVNGNYAGNIGAHHIDWENECCQLGYWVAGAFEGLGFISEAVALLERELFGLGFHRIEIHCDPHNVRSAAVPKRAGYHLEGVLRENELRAGGRRKSTMIWGKLSSGAKSSKHSSRDELA